MNKKEVKVTVLMPVYNCSKYLRESIDSILNQSFSDFEFLIINDGSTDSSLEIIKSYRDQRISIIRNEKRIGLPATLNKGFKQARGQYIVRMDCDDVSHLERLQKQVTFMSEHPEVGVCGTWVEIFGLHEGIVWKYPLNHERIMISMLFNSALAHPSVIIHKSFFHKHDLYYNTDFDIAQDFELWQRCSSLFHLANIPEALLKYRIYPSSHFRSRKHHRIDVLTQIYEKNFSSMNLKASEEEIKLHYSISTNRFPRNRQLILQAGIWLQKIINANAKNPKYKHSLLAETLSNKWFKICSKRIKYGLWNWKIFWNHPLSKSNTIPLKSKIKFAFLALIYQNFLMSKKFFELIKNKNTSAFYEKL